MSTSADLITLSITFFFYYYGDHRDLHSFPTRRSSDLGNSFINTMKNIHHTRSSIGDDIRNILCSSANMRRAISFFFQAEDGIRDATVTGVQTCALPISLALPSHGWSRSRQRQSISAPVAATISVLQIGRASCRERVEISVVDGLFKTMKNINHTRRSNRYNNRNILSRSVNMIRTRRRTR